MVFESSLVQGPVTPSAAHSFDRARIDLQVQQFRTCRDALAGVRDYIASLQTRAGERRSVGLPVSDQDNWEEAFRLLPPMALDRSLAIVGGMGPLAGALAFRAACERFGDARAIVLYQACSVPDRTALIMRRRNNASSRSDRDMAASLARAVGAAVDLLPSNAAQADCVIACNSAHFFWELLKSEVTSIPRLEQRLNLVSTVECAIRALRDLTRGPVLLLCTQGARVGCIFSSAAAKANIPFIELGPDLECVLMRLIYEGPKSLNESKTVALGTYFFETVEKRMANIDCILAGCTELPAVVELLREQGTPAVRSFLSRVAIVDPMNAVLDAVACHAGG